MIGSEYLTERQYSGSIIVHIARSKRIVPSLFQEDRRFNLGASRAIKNLNGSPAFLLRQRDPDAYIMSAHVYGLLGYRVAYGVPKRSGSLSHGFPRGLRNLEVRSEHMDFVGYPTEDIYIYIIFFEGQDIFPFGYSKKEAPRDAQRESALERERTGQLSWALYFLYNS